MVRINTENICLNNEILEVKLLKKKKRSVDSGNKETRAVNRLQNERITEE